MNAVSLDNLFQQKYIQKLNLFRRTALAILFIIILHSSCKTDNKWEKMPSPFASSTRSFAENGNVWFVGTSSGIYKSSDIGQNWKESGLKGKVVDEIFVTKSGAILAGVYRNGLYQSNNNGKDWARIGFENNVYLYSIVQNKRGFLFLAASFISEEAPKTTKTGVFASYDDGKSWKQTAVTDANIISLNLLENDILFASNAEKTYISKNEGKNWYIGGYGLPKGLPISTVIAKDNILYASLGNRQEETGATRGGVYSSTDNGLNWTKSDQGIDVKSPITNLIVVGNDLIASAGFEQKNGYVGLYKSSDSGKNWFKYRLEDSFCRFIKKTENGKIIIGTNNAALFISDSKLKDLAQIGKGIDNWETFRVTGNNDNLFATGNGIWEFDKKVQTWKLIRKSNSIDLAVTPNGNLLIFENNQIIRLDRHKSNWSTVKTIVGDYALFKVFNEKLIVAGFAGNGSWHSTDQGITWTKYYINGFENASMRTAVLSEKGTLFLSGTLKNSKTFRSVDSGKSFKTVNDLDSMEVWDFATIGETIYAGTYANGIYKSIDDGLSWLPCNNGLKDKKDYLTITSIITIDSKNLICASLGKGLFYSKDAGENWHPLNNGIRDDNFWTLYFNQKSNTIYATSPSGIYQMALQK
ncbi:MAG: hypothetical protein EOO47_00895 [Flavobacterium sp.]|nr:MAG: hypothetical protein EOO47_00895 [Flavobacterium sp.]